MEVSFLMTCCLRLCFGMTTLQWEEMFVMQGKILLVVALVRQKERSFKGCTTSYVLVVPSVGRAVAVMVWEYEGTWKPMEIKMSGEIPGGGSQLIKNLVSLIGCFWWCFWLRRAAWENTWVNF